MTGRVLNRTGVPTLTARGADAGECSDFDRSGFKLDRSSDSDPVRFQTGPTLTGPAPGVPTLTGGAVGRIWNRTGVGTLTGRISNGTGARTPAAGDGDFDFDRSDSELDRRPAP